MGEDSVGVFGNWELGFEIWGLGIVFGTSKR